MKYPAYPKYKPSGVEWLGEVPEHWEVKRLKFLANRSDQKVEADEDYPLPYVGLEHIESWTGKLLTLDAELVPSGISNRFRRGDTLFGKLRPYLAKACNPGFDGLCSTELLVLEPRGHERNYLVYQLLSEGFVSMVDSSTYGAKMPRANWEFIGSCLLPSPPPAEQRAIADFLDRETAKLDTLVAKKRELLEKLREKRTALISRTVTRGLPSEAARAAGLDPHPKLKPSGIEWLGEVPEHWEALPLKYVASIKTGFAFSSDDFIDDGVPVIRIGDITKDGQVNFSDGKFLTKEFLHSNHDVVVQHGDIVMAMTGATIGKAGRYSYEKPALLNQRVCIFRPNLDNLQDYIWYLLNAEFYIEHVLLTAFGGAQPNISDTELLACFVPLPPPPEQRAIADYLNRETAKIDQMAAKVEEAIARLQEYRTALITAAVTGKIDVREAK